MKSSVFSPDKSDLPNPFAHYIATNYYKNAAKVLRPFVMAVDSFIRIILPQQMQAKTITDSAFSFESQLLLQNQNAIALMQSIHQTKPDIEGVIDGNYPILSESINDFFSAYLAQGKIAKYRRATITELQQRITHTLTGNDCLALLNDINQYAYQAFHNDEIHNRSTTLFKRNFRFSRYQLMMHHLRSLTLCAIPSEQLQSVVEQEVADIKRTIAVFDKQFIADNSSLDAFFNQVIAYSTNPKIKHFLTPVLKNRCEFLNQFLDLEHCQQLNRHTINMNADCLVIPSIKAKVSDRRINELSWSQRNPLLANCLYWFLIGLTITAMLSGIIAAIAFSGGTAGAVLLPLLGVAYSSLGLYGTIGAFIGASIGLSFVSYAIKSTLDWITSEDPQQQEKPPLIIPEGNHTLFGNNIQY